MSSEPQNPPAEQISEKLDGFSSRQRAILRGSAFLYGLGSLGLLVCLMAVEAQLGASLDLVVGTGIGWMVVIVSVLGLVVGLRSAQTRSRIRQANRVEELVPEFRMRLNTVVEHLESPSSGHSADLLDWTAQRAAQRLESVQASEVHPSRPLKRAAVFFLACTAVWAALDQWGSPGPSGLLRWMDQQSQPVTVVEQGPAQQAAETAVVAEVVLRYTYPEYTGMSPLEVPNSNGTAHGPPGTRVDVSARTAEPFERASLRVLDGEPVQAELAEGRDLSASFVIRENGSYQFHLHSGQTVSLSPEFGIEVEPDLAPTVELQATSDRIEIEYNRRLPIAWSARDDFGVDRVEAIVGEKAVPIRDPLENSLGMEGSFRKTPQELGLEPGQEVELVIRAWDNDEVSGSKPGDSRSIRVKVLGPQASSRRMARLWRELRDALLDMLAEHVTDPDPPASTQSSMLAWAGEAARRLDPVDALVEEYWDAFQSNTVESLIVDEVRRVSGSLLRFAQSISMGRTDEPIRAPDLASFSDLRTDLIQRSEQAILMLDQMVRYQALAKLNRLAQMMAQQGTALEERNESGARLEEVLGRMDGLENQSGQLRQAARDFNGGDLSEFVEGSLDDADRLMERIREEVGQNREEKGRERIPTLAENLRMMAAGVDHMQRQMEAEGEEMANMIEELKEELERLETEERGLQEQTVSAREEFGQGQDSIANLWARAEALAAAAFQSLSEVAAGTDTSLGFTSQELLLAQEGAEQSSRVQQAVGGRDLESARLEVSRAIPRVARAQEAMSWRESRRDEVGQGIPQADDLQQKLRAGTSSLQELSDLLRSLDASLNSASPELQEASQRLSLRQRQLEGETQEARQMASQLSEQLPMGAPGLNEGMDGAVREMDRATDSLSRARTVEAEGAEGAAADRLRQALEALEQAAAAMAQMQDAMRGEGQSGERSQAQRGDEEEQHREPIEIPAPEEFQTPEEYRKALLEGMQGEVPSEFESLKRRYYEELVRQ